MGVLAVVLRIAHVAAAMIVGGAVVFQLVALRPALRGLAEAGRKAVLGQVAARWRGVVFVCIGLLLVTGLLNFVLFKVPAYGGHASVGVYHGLFGLKLLAALAAFHAAALLILPGPRFDKYRAGAGFWLTYLTVLLALIVVLGALLNNFGRLFP